MRSSNYASWLASRSELVFLIWSWVPCMCLSLVYCPPQYSRTGSSESTGTTLVKVSFAAWGGDSGGPNFATLSGDNTPSVLAVLSHGADPQPNWVARLQDYVISALTTAASSVRTQPDEGLSFVDDIAVVTR